jgi:hypothetical protein
LAQECLLTHFPLLLSETRFQKATGPHGGRVHTRGGYEGPHMEHKTLAADAQNDQEVSHRANTSLCVWNTCIACDTNQQATHPDTEH